MLSVYCPVHGAEVLLSERRIEGLVNHSDRIEVRWVCWCGARGSFTTGRPERRRLAPRTAPRVPAITR